MTTLGLDAATTAVFPQGSSPCMDRLNARSWHSTIAVCAGSYVVGVRLNSPYTRDVVEDLLGAIRVPEEDANVSPNLSVEIAGPEIGPHRQLHLIYRDHVVASRRRETRESWIDLIELLDEFAKLTCPDTMVAYGTAVFSPSGACLVPAAMHRDLLTRGPRLASAGLTMSRGRYQRLTMDGPTSLVPGLVDPELIRIREDLRVPAIEAMTEQTVRTWFIASTGGDVLDVRPAHGVFGAFRTVVNAPVIGAGAALRRLAESAARTDFVALPALSPPALAETLISASKQT